jgi:hypothetical protein
MRCNHIPFIPAIIVIFVCLTVNPAFAHSAIYVDDNAPANGDGVCWDTAFKFLQDALAVASAGDIVLVAQGIYKPDRSAVSREVEGN